MISRYSQVEARPVAMRVILRQDHAVAEPDPVCLPAGRAPVTARILGFGAASQGFGQ